MRPIDGDALTERLEALAYEDWNQGVCTSLAEAFNRFADIVRSEPTVYVETIRCGQWIERTKVYPDLPNDSTYNYECSECGYMDTHGSDVEVPFCWHCGAKMDGEKNV